MSSRSPRAESKENGEKITFKEIIPMTFSKTILNNAKSQIHENTR